MTTLKGSVDRLVAILAACTAPTLTLLTLEHILSAEAATAVGGIVAAAVAGYHANNDKARAALAVEPSGQ